MAFLNRLTCGTCGFSTLNGGASVEVCFLVSAAVGMRVFFFIFLHMVHIFLVRT